MPAVRTRGSFRFCFWCSWIAKIRRGVDGRCLLGYAIGSAVEMNQNFNDCLEARGWRIADGNPPARGPMAASLVPSEPATPSPAPQ